MKFCDRHWDLLKDAIDARGLTPFVPTSTEDAVWRLKDAESRKDWTAENFDPLMVAHNAIVGNVMANADAMKLDMEDKGDSSCPVCMANDLHAAHCNHKDCGLLETNGCDIWIDYAADNVAELAAEIGVIASA